MKFAVQAWSKKGRARVGVLQLANPTTETQLEIETPALLLSTRKGLPSFISPDLLPCLPSPDSHLLQCSPLHFLEGLNLKTMSSIGGLHRLLGLHEHGFATVPRDSISCLPDCDSTNKTGASFETPCGRLLIKPSEYMEMISSMKPNLWATLADEVPAWVSAKRNKTSVDRTLKWLDDCIALSSTGGAIFGAIVGGSSVEERQRCAQEVAKRNVSGYWIGGFGHGESMNERHPLLDAIMDYLPEQKPRYVCGLGLPDTSPLVDGCSCYTCQNHTKAYINHLLNVHEMLAQILLEIHNTHHYLGFFRVIREAIKEGSFQQYQQKFVESRRDHMFAASLSS
ncbi:uncharacterized protein LOC127808121 isoform X3 [Diospyros lotus]|uniref:uncharacterized protein LOC127808121 isoform X3 n=1 Tax=Diospyros lotus TaxID=55363 RepID=UPI00225479F0|nr:uncharacterized protein LOC127808121 isoform X3 [Diospyros lotus]